MFAFLPCLSGLHWHLSGLSELPLEHRLLLLLAAGEPFPLFFVPEEDTRVAVPTYIIYQIDNWNHLYLSIFPVGYSVILL